MKTGTELTLEIEALAFGGKGLSRVDGFVIFVENALPGQLVRAKIRKKRKGYAEARTIEVLQASPEQVSPRCLHFGECGGCRLQNLAYDSQLKYKRAQVADSLKHIGGIESSTVLPALASPEQFYYRNKMEYSFGRERWLSKSEIDSDAFRKPRDFALGLHVPGRFDRILDLDECFLQSPESVNVLAYVRQYIVAAGVPAYSTKDQSGFWRHLVVRQTRNTHQMMINLVTADDSGNEKHVRGLAERLTQEFDFISTIIHSVNRKKAEVATGDEEYVLFGPGYIEEQIGQWVFRISANSFFQANTRGTEMLYERIIEFGALNKEDIVFDLYSGVGTIAIYISTHVKQVVGFEVVGAAVEDAWQNCRLNGVDNCRFVSGDLRSSLNSAIGSGQAAAHVVVVDPPRAGMHEQVVRELLNLRPERFVYVSCNPTTFARDAAILCHRDYELQIVQPVDMFPMTAHVELVGSFRVR